MLDKERETLENRKSEYLSIGISNGNRMKSIPVPWELTAHAFNMKTPDVYIQPEDLRDSDLMAKIKSFHVLGCYAFTRLFDYAFIADFPEIRDIYIVDGANVKDISFISTLKDCRMLHLENAHLKDLEPIYLLSLFERRFSGFCLSLFGCTVDDVSALHEVNNLSELIIAGADDEVERARWKSIPAYTHRYYVIKNDAESSG